MRCEELSLKGPMPLTFPDGTRAVISYFSQIDRSDWRGHCHIAIPDKPELDLLDAVDDGQTVDEPRIHAIYGISPNDVFLFGGPKAYMLDSTGTIRERVELYREREFEEYWATAIESTEAGTLLIYESGCLLLDEMLQVQWHVKKYFNDFLHSVSGGEVQFLRDHKEHWSLALDDGHVIGSTDRKQTQNP